MQAKETPMPAKAKKVKKVKPKLSEEEELQEYLEAKLEDYCDALPRDLINDPVFLRHLLRDTWSCLPPLGKALDRALGVGDEERGTTREDVGWLVYRVAMVLAEEELREYPQLDDEEEEEDDQEDEEEEDESDEDLDYEEEEEDEEEDD